MSKTQITRITTRALLLIMATALLAAALPVSLYASPRVSAANWVLIDSASGQVLAEQLCMDRAFPASTTKILTAYVVLSKTGLSNNLVVPKEAKVGGSHIFLATGAELSLEDALHALMLSSANDAAVTLAFGVSGSVDAFSQEMNKAARELGAQASNFVNPHGLPNDNHYTTALDLALITRAAMQNPAFARIVSTRTREVSIKGSGERQETLNNHNRLLLSYDGCTGVKTGFTQQSRHCIVAAAERNGRELIAVVLGAQSATAMWRDATSLLDYGFTAFAPKQILKKGQQVAQFPVERGKTEVRGVSSGSLSILEGGAFPEVQVKTVLTQGLKAPLKAGAKVGTISVMQMGRALSQLDVVVGQDVAAEFSLGLPPRAYAFPIAMGVSLLAVYLSRRGLKKRGDGVSARADRASDFRARRRRYQRKSWDDYGRG